MQDLAIQVKELLKSYKQLHILKGVDFEVKQGSIFALLGSNGAEKQPTLEEIFLAIVGKKGGK